MKDGKVTSPDDRLLGSVCDELREISSTLDAPGAWPVKQLDCCARHGVFEWFVPHEFGGQAWGEAETIRGYLQLSAACLTTTFVITQLTGACRRIAAGENQGLKERLLPAAADGRSLATVGISHLTTSRRHLDRPVLRARLSEQGVTLEGFSPWVTGAGKTDHIVTGATLEDGREVLVVVPTDVTGVEVPPTLEFVALTASHTGRVNFNHVELGPEWLLAGPMANVMQQGIGARSGGLQTSTLALGLAREALDYLSQQAVQREELRPPYDEFRGHWEQLRDFLMALVDGDQPCTASELRSQANSLVLRLTQGALAAAKGSGYVAGHPTGRWCQEALFFLVWSCPQPVMAANLCEFAGLAGE